MILKSIISGDTSYLKGYFSSRRLLIKIILSRFNNQNNWKISDKQILDKFSV